MGALSDHCDIIPITSEGQWHEERAKGIGGSDLGAILGLSKYASPWSVWALKSGLVPKDDAGAAAAWGHLLEAPIAEMYARETGEAIVEWPSVSLVSKRYPYMRANIDRLRVKPSEQFPAGVVTTWGTREEPRTDEPPGIIGILEIKSGGIASYGNVEEWDNDAIPEGYQMQGYHYGIVSGITDIRYAALLGGHGLQLRTLDWDEDVAENIVQVESWFWALVESGDEPPLDGHRATLEAVEKLSRTPEKEFDGGDDLEAMWSEYQALKDQEAEMRTKANEVRGVILRSIQDAEVGLANGRKLFTFRLTKGRETFDQDAFKAEHPELYQKFTSRGNPYRRLMASRSKAS